MSSWYSVKQLDYSLICKFCLKQFNFPITKVRDKYYFQWTYRLIGPFALPDYARGGYATTLAIRFFIRIIGDSKVTWLTSQEITTSEGKKVEADFILWHKYSEKYGNHYPVERVFGEVKSFANNALEENDIDKMKLLVESGYCSILVFATMKDELSHKDIDCLRSFVEWERKREQSVPLMILTGLELFAQKRLYDTWDNSDKKRKELIKKIPKGNEVTLQYFAYLTQKLHLDLEIPPDVRQFDGPQIVLFKI